MKQHISKFLKSIAVFYLGFFLEYIIFLAVLFNIPANSCIRILLSPTYYLTAALSFLVGVGLWEMKRWTWHLLVVVNAWILYQSATYWTDYGQSFHGFLAFGTWLIFMGFITYRVGKEIRVPYFFPKIRWWESNPRYKLSVPVEIHESSSDFSAIIMDLSPAGCFIKTQIDLPENGRVNIKFFIFNINFECEGVVVWKPLGSVTYPKGIGLKFANLKRTQKRELRLVTQRLRKISAFYRRFRYLLGQEEFTRGLEELESRPLEVEGK